MKKITALVVILAFCLGFSGCAGMSDTQQRTLSGAAIGAAAGTAIGAMSGNAGWGAAIGTAAGAGAGLIVDHHEKSKENAYRQGYEAGRTNQ
jgi:hypothetical protein